MKELIQRIVQKREKRGFVNDPLKIQLMITEEVGEISRELKKSWSMNYEDFDKDKLAEEIADTFTLVAALANAFDIDIQEAVESKFFGADEKRKWKSEQDSFQ